MCSFEGRYRLAVLLTVLMAAGVPLAAQETPPQGAAQASPGVRAQESWEDKWLSFSNKALTARWGWMFILDGAVMTQDGANEEQVGRVPAKAEPRADRFILGGTLKFKTPWKYLIGANYNGLDAEPGKKFSWLDLALDVPLASWLGSLNIGRQKVGVAQEWMMPGTDMVFMERSAMDLSFVPQRNIGLKLRRSFADGRGTYSAGVFNDWFVNDRSISENGTQYTGRVSYLPVDRNEGENMVSIATSVYFKEATQGTLRFRARPEVNQADYFVDTESFAANHSTSTKFEVLAIKESTQAFGELTLNPVDAPTVGNPFFDGGLAGVSHVLTGEVRPYNSDGGFYGKVIPRSPFSLRHGGPGAWELSGRYSYVDLTDGGIDGGTMSRLTGAISWYPDKYWRIEFNYGHGILDRGGTRGHFNVFHGRAQFGF